MNVVKEKYQGSIDIIVLSVFCVLMYSFLSLNIPTDIQLHIKHSIRINSTDTSYPANFLFYFLVNLFSGFTDNQTMIHTITVVLLSAATVAKYVISKKIIIQLGRNTLQQLKNSKITLIALGLFFCFALPDPIHLLVWKKMYLGKFVPFVWHNSTTILLFPFALLLFWKQLRVFDTAHKTTNKDILMLNLLVVLNLIIKPSFIFVYIPVTSIFLLPKLRIEPIKTLLLKASPILTGVFVILLQYFSIYIMQAGSIQEEASSIVISSPFEILTHWVPGWFIPLSIITSFALPIVSAFFFKELMKFKPFLYSLSLTVTGILISAFIMESGPRMFHGNFMWQNVICAYLLFFSTILFLIPKLLGENSKSKKVLIIKGLFIAHACSGILYLIKTGVIGTYY